MQLYHRVVGQAQHVARIVCNQYRRPAALLSRLFSTSDSGQEGEVTAGEKLLTDKLQQAFPDATHILVSDVSGGCGAMYQISIESQQFEGKRTIQQHRMVNEVLAEEIKVMHGLQLNTKAPDRS